MDTSQLLLSNFFPPSLSLSIQILNMTVATCHLTHGAISRVLLASGWGGNDILVYDRPFNSTNFFSSFFHCVRVWGRRGHFRWCDFYPPGNQLKTIFSDHQNRKEIKNNSDLRPALFEKWIFGCLVIFFSLFFLILFDWCESILELPTHLWHYNISSVVVHRRRLFCGRPLINKNRSEKMGGLELLNIYPIAPCCTVPMLLLAGRLFLYLLPGACRWRSLARCCRLPPALPGSFCPYVRCITLRGDLFFDSSTEGEREASTIVRKS